MNVFIDIFLLDLVKTKRKKIEIVLKSRRLVINFICKKKIEIIIVLTFF